MFTDKKDNKPAIIAIAFIVLAGTFYAGMTFGMQKGGWSGDRATGERGAMMPGGDRAFAAREGQGGGQGGRGGVMSGGVVAGEILSKDEKGITVKLTDGGSKIVFLADTTVISKSEAATTDDLAVGTNVVVMGTANADGSVTARTVRLGEQPIMMQAPDQKK